MSSGEGTGIATYGRTISLEKTGLQEPWSRSKYVVSFHFCLSGMSSQSSVTAGQMLTEAEARSQNTSPVNDNVSFADAPAKWNRRIKLADIDREIDT